MTVLSRDVAGPPLAPQGSVLCIGAFDGVHLGHQALLARVRERANALGLSAAVISFEPIPREFFAAGASLARLGDARDKLRQLQRIGIDHLLMLRFNEQLAALSAEDFVQQVIVGRMQAQEIWVGADFRFGNRRRGDVVMLHELGLRYGFRVQVFEEFMLDGVSVRSSTIRSVLASGDFIAAERLLGRPFRIAGRVLRGQQLGRTLGYPTANLRLGRRTSPVHGIFAVRVHGVAATALPAVASLGVRPTVTGAGEVLLEVHLFDFCGDLYGRRIAVEFVAKLRDEEKFSDLASMVQQIDLDAAGAREVLGLPADARSGVKV